jgi:hypothetical protein
LPAAETPPPERWPSPDRVQGLRQRLDASALTRLLTSRGGTWVRTVLYGALVCVGLLCGLQAWTAHRTQQTQEHSAESIRLATAQHTHSQRIAHLAALLALPSLPSRPEEAAKPRATLLQQLRLAQDASMQEALQLDDLLRQRPADAVGARPRARPPLAAQIHSWQDAREHLWYQTENLLRGVDLLPTDPQRAALHTLEAQAEKLEVHTQSLVKALRDEALRQNQHSAGQV